MAEGRGPIKVGTGYVEVVPKVMSKDMAELRAKITSELEKIGASASKEMQGAVTKGLAGLPKEVQKQAKKAKQAVEAEAKDSAETIAELEKFVTKQYGEQAKKRLSELRQFYGSYERMTEEASGTTRQALRETVRQEERAAKDRLAAERSRAQETARLERQQTADQQKELQRQVQAQRAAARQQVAEIRAQAQAQREAIQGQIAAQQTAIRDARGQIALLRRSMADSSSAASSYFKRVESGMKNMGGWFHEVGTSITEAGNLLTDKFLAPLAMAGSALTAVGVQNADQRLLGQLGLTSAGVSTKVSAQQMKTIQQYAINTPYSIDVMHEYQMKLIRSMAGADKSWYSKNPTIRTKAANNAAGKTTDLIMAVGDSMARAGNLSPDMFRRAMYAMDMILDMDRAPTRNLKQLASAAGMPASELANLLGFKSSTEMWKIVGTPAKDGGGVTGQQIANAMLNYWDPKKYSKEGTQTGSGSKGFAETMTAETITGRLQQMKERGTFELGNMFVREGKDGQYEYTPLGEKLMGKKVPITKSVYDKTTHGFEQTVVGYKREGGVLGDVSDMAKKYAPDVQKFLGKFLDSVSNFVSMIDKVVGWIKKSGLDKLAGAVGNFLIKWGPLILAVGLTTKLFGKLLKIGSSVISPARAAGRGVLSAYDAINGSDARERRQARSTARQSVLDAGGSRRDARAAGQQAARDTRTRQTGDDRSAGRRITDRLTGNDQRAQRTQIRDLEDQIRDAERETARLRDDLRQVNSATMRQIADALGGRGNGSVAGAARTASSDVDNIQTQAQQLNRQNLNQVAQEIEKLRKAAKDAGKEIGTARDKVNNLNGAKTDKVHSQISNLKSEAEQAGKNVTSINTRIGNLNGKSLKGITGSVDGLKTAAKEAADQVGDGAMSKSTSGRVANLNKRRLTDIIKEFTKLHAAAKDAYDMVGQGTGAKSLAGRIGLLNGRSLKDITQRVKDLETALRKAKNEGDGLDDALDRIGKKSPGGGGSSSGSKKRRKKKARGGIMRDTDVMPGYQPWADSIPTLLTPGESVLRPEVTQAIGPERINAWNSLAIRGRISRHARGTDGGRGKFNLDDLKRLVDLQNIYDVGDAMLRTMGMDATSDDLGGSTQSGVLGTGDIAARFGGSAAAEKFRGMYDWMTRDLWKFMEKVPDVVGQIAGVIVGSVEPTLGQYFWDDVWKGQGNIVERGQTYLGDVFSWKTLGSVWDGLFGGVKDSLSSIWDVATNPVDAFSGAISDIGDVVSGSYNNLVSMVQTVKDVSSAPMEYAGRVYDGFMEDARDAMPNTKGLFDFSKGAKVKAKPISEAMMGKALSKPGSGGSVERWTPQAKTALQMLGLPASALPTVLHRIGVESGGNPGIVNTTDSNWQAGHPSVGLVQVIENTFKRYAGPFAKTGPFKYGVSIDPMANLYAGLNYAVHRYPNSWQSVLAGNTGYASGTLSASPGFAMVGEKGRELVAFGGGQRVLSNAETEGLLNGRRYEIHIHEARNEPTPQAVMRALQTAETLFMPPL
ncbi:transglycosylase SLT domain-containing protein [Streptomyces griseofuscus]|uniref:transglycosylase SLT domain-containing protein n=1 Tax=Streptomyces griseofuscus TaxID=146922 RepID=UPI003683BB9F